MLNLKPTTIRRQIKEGKIKGLKVGRGWHVSEENIDKYKSYYSVKETAELLSISEITVRKYFAQDKIKALKFGNQWYAEEKAIKEYLSNIDNN